jgi:membrane-bound lytic murein transglycosylase D
MSSINFFKKSFVLALLQVGCWLPMQAQDAKITEQSQLDAAYKAAKASLDSAAINKNYQQALNLFLDYCDYIHPLQFNQIEELSVAEAQEEILQDKYLYTPDSTSLLLNDQDISYDFAPFVSDEVVAERLAALNTTIPMTFNKDIRVFIDYFTVRRRTYTQTMLARKNLYFPIFEKYLSEFGLPDELKYLSIVESALKPAAVSRAGACGLWQFMPTTGKHLGLRQDQYIDERINPEKATIAACKYLTWLYNFFDQDWELALAAYNCGPGTVQRAIRKAGGRRNFWEIYRFLPAETRAYVPMFVAVTYSMTHAEDHNIIQNQPYYPIEHETVIINKYVNLKDLAEKLRVCLDDLVELNPELKKKVIPAHFKNYALKIPAERSQYFWENQEYVLASSKNDWRYEAKMILKDKNRKDRYAKMKALKEKRDKLSEAEQNRQETKRHTILRGESLSEIADQYSVSVAQLMAWNKLKNSHIRSGKSIVVKPAGHQKPITFMQGDGQIAGKDKINLHPEINTQNKEVIKSSKGKKSKQRSTEAKTETRELQTYNANASTHTIKSGESLWIVANKYKTSIAKIKQLNGLKSDKLAVGQKIVVK